MKHLEINELIHPKNITYFIPTFDDLARIGIELMSKAVGEELMELLESNNSQYLTLKDHNKILELIDHDGFDEETAGMIHDKLQSMSVRITSYDD